MMNEKRGPRKSGFQLLWGEDEQRSGADVGRKADGEERSL